MKIKIYFTFILLGVLNAQLPQDKFQKAKSALNEINNTTPTYQPPKRMSIKEATLLAINKIRTSPQICSNPVKPLRWNENLYLVTKEHSIDMAVNTFTSHQGSGTATDITARRLRLKRGSYFYERVNQKKNSTKILSAELVTAVNKNFYKTPQEILNYWIKRPKDCKVIMDPRFSDVALSKVISKKNNKAYWTLMLIGKR